MLKSTGGDTTRAARVLRSKTKQPKSDTVELGAAAYTTEEERTRRARFEFLQAIRQKCPAPLLELRDKLFPRYCEWAEFTIEAAVAGDAFHQSPEGIDLRTDMQGILMDLGLPEQAAMAGAVGRPPLGRTPDDPIFREFMLLQFYQPTLERALMEWAQRFNLTHERQFGEPQQGLPPEAPEVGDYEPVDLSVHDQYWACQWAVQTMWQWRFTDIGPRNMNENPPRWLQGQFVAAEVMTVNRLAPIALDEDGWRLELESEPRFRDRISAAIDTFLDRHIVDSRRRAERLGLIPTPRKKREHFEWLAMYQVESEMTHEAIAKAYGAEVPTVAAGIKDVASLVLLQRRRGQRGPEPEKPKIEGSK